MKKNGFTLVELIGSIVILAMIALIALPSIINMVQTGRGKLSSSVKNIIESSALEYVYANQDNYPKHFSSTLEDCNKTETSNESIIPYSTLNDQGYVDASFKEKYKTDITDKSCVKVQCNNKKYKTTFYTTCPGTSANKDHYGIDNFSVTDAN